MIASLMMYLRPEVAVAHDHYWALIRKELALRGINSPALMSNDAGAFDVWQDPQLVLSQTCGMPYRRRLHGDVTLIGTPDFGVEGCAPGYYRSAIVVRSDDTRASLPHYAKARFAYNQTLSQSGFAAPYAHCAAQGFWFEDRLVSGGHLASAQMVAQGDADIAALDAVTWRLIEQYEAFVSQLRVIEWTEPTPGLPYIAAKGVDKAAAFDAISNAIVQLSPQDRTTLGIRGLIDIPATDYLAVPNPPADAA